VSWPDIVTDNLVCFLHAARADGGLRPGINGAPTRVLHDLSGRGNHGTLVGFGYDAPPFINHATNPNYETDGDSDGRCDGVSYWSFNGTPTWTQVAGPSAGTYAQRLQYTGTGADNDNLSVRVQDETDVGSFAAGDPVSMSLWLKGAIDAGITAYLRVTCKDSGGGWLADYDVAFTVSSSFARKQISFTCPAGTSYLQPQLRFTDCDIGESLDVSFALCTITKTSAPPTYFDGDSAGCEWLGTPDLSASRSSSLWPSPSGWSGIGSEDDPHCLVGDGDGDYVACAGGAPGTGDFSIDGWMRIDNVADNHGLFFGRNFNGALGWGIYVRTGVAYGFLCTTSYSDRIQQTVSTGLDTGWHHLGASFDRDGYLRTYLDGSYVAQADISSKAADDFSTDPYLFSYGWVTAGAIASAREYSAVLDEDGFAQNFAAGYTWDEDPVVGIVVPRGLPERQPPQENVSLIVGDSIDLVAEGLVKPENVQDADCEHGFESARFILEDQMPHVPAVNQLIDGASVKVYRDGKRTFEGEIAILDDAGITHEVKCAGVYRKLRRREDFSWAGVISNNWDEWRDVSTESVEDDSDGKFATNVNVQLDNQILFTLPASSVYKDFDTTQIVWELLDGLAPGDYEISKITFDIRYKLGTDQGFIVYVLGANLLGVKAGWSRNNDTDTEHVELTPTSGAQSIEMLWTSDADGTLGSAENYVQIRELHIYVNRTSKPRVDEIIEEIACPADGSICASAEAEELGDGISFWVPPHTTRADAIEQARARYAGILDVGVWDDAIAHIRARPTLPAAAQNHYAIRAENLLDPNDWRISRDVEQAVEAICGKYELVDANLVIQNLFDSTAWPDNWERSSATNNEIYNSGVAYYVRCKSDGTEPNPYSRTPISAQETIVEGGRSYLGSCLAYLGAYNDGTGYVYVWWYDEDGNYISGSYVARWTASSPTEAGYERYVTAPSNAAFAKMGPVWSGASGTSTCSIYARNFSLKLSANHRRGPLRTRYYPSNPSAADAQVRLLDLGQATDAQAAAAVQQVYEYYSQLATGSCPLHGLVEDFNGAVHPVSHIRSWDWVSKVDALDEEDRGPFMLSRCERNGDGTVSIEIGGDYWEHPGFEHAERKKRYVGERRVRTYKWVRRKVRGKKRRVKVPKGWRVIPAHYV